MRRGVNHATISFTPNDGIGRPHLFNDIDFAHGGCRVLTTMSIADIFQARVLLKLLTVAPGVCAST